MSDGELHFYFDPICPFAWMTSKWVRMVVAQRDYSVDWRFISLRMVNEKVDYSAQFPPEYEGLHQAGLKLLRVAAQVRQDFGREAVGRFYATLGGQLWDTERPWGDPANPELLESALAAADLPVALRHTMETGIWDDLLRDETNEALSLTGKDVGTPILHFQPPSGLAFFGPVISRLPSEADAVRLWDHVIGLAGFPGFAEVKRSLREMPQLRALGIKEDEVGSQEDWHGGSRRLKK